ncbi:MAG: hypothetical protein AAF985_24765 [Bacteroidota bacterium]
MSTIKNSFLILGLCLMSGAMIAQEAQLPTQSISIFKNNTAFFIKSGQVNTENGQYKMTQSSPAALYGTFWFHSPQNALANISSFEEESTTIEKRSARSVAQMIKANLKKKMKLFLYDDLTYEGTIEHFELGTKDILRTGASDGGDVLTIQTSTGWVSLPISSIRRVEFMEKPQLEFDHSKTKKQRILQIDFNNKSQQQALDMMYLTSGINWSPIYLLELKSDTKARLTLRGELTNDAEDMVNTNINFVVGVPNFKFANRLTPLVDFLKNVAPRPSNDWSATSNALRSQSISYGIQSDDFSNAPIAGAGNTEGSTAEDLYFYHLKNISLKKGGRAQYPLFEQDIDIAHIYESNLSQNSENRGFYQKEFLFSPDTDNKVFHSVKVSNNSIYPWTTAAVMVTNVEEGTKPISQDMLSYTPIKGHSFVKLTEAPDIRIKHAEKEISREERIKKKQNNYYLDLVTVEGKVKIKNYKSKKVDLNIRRTIIGTLEKSSVEWLSAETVNRGGNFNKTNQVCWETSLDAGEALEITYQYKVYIGR